MSYRICNNCDYVICNRIHQKYNCPECDSSKMVCPLEDGRDFHEEYLTQELAKWQKYYDEEKDENVRIKLFIKTTECVGKLMDYILNRDKK